MKRYEVIAIAKSALPEEDITKLIDRIEGIIVKDNGVVAKIDKWGKRRLAYEINKEKEGYYFLFDFAGDGPMVTEIERNFKIDDRIIKFITIKKDGAVTREGIDAEIAAAEAKKAQPAADAGSASSEGKTIVPAGKNDADKTSRNFEKITIKKDDKEN
ncbi:MAG: 30S ribosomal protein S6 [Syntrophaceae bacterium]|nr:30S ribosomal protein S6 [Syntrophaceae bacterium]